MILLRVAAIVGVGSLLTASLVLAKEPEYKRRDLVQIDPKTGKVTGTETGPTEDQVPVPFPFKKPVDEADPEKNVGAFRSLSALKTILAKMSSEDLAPGVVQKPIKVTLLPNLQAVGTSDKTVAREDIFLINVAADPLPFEFGPPFGITFLRPDGSMKGDALLVAGIHAREWMAFESLVRYFEQFLNTGSGGFEDKLKALRAETGTGDLLVFFAENVHTRFVPLMSPPSIQLTQDDFDKCYMILNNSGITGADLDKGFLRHGRFRRKNLVEVHSSVLEGAGVNGHVKDPTALLGVAIDRNLTDSSFASEDKGLTDRKSADYRGPHVGSEHESLAFGIATSFAFTLTTRHTGAAALDIHTPLDHVSFPSSTVTGISAQKAYAEAINKFAKPGNKLHEVLAPIFGSPDSYVASKNMIPAATLELPHDPAIDKMVGTGLDFTPFPDGTTYTANTGASLSFLVSEGKEGYEKQKEKAAAGIDAALLWAAGPPSVRAVLLLQAKTSTDGTYMRPAPKPGDAEVVYYKAMVPGSSVVRTQSDQAKGERWANATSTIKVMIAFAKPMRDADSLAVKMIPGPTPGSMVPDPSTGPLTTLEFVQADADSTSIFTIPSTKGSWQTKTLAKGLKIDGTDPITPGAKRYDYDTWIAEFEPKDMTINGRKNQDARFRIQTSDRVGLVLDADPGTIAGWSGGDWVDYERDGARGKKKDADETWDGFQIDTVHPIYVPLPKAAVAPK